MISYCPKCINPSGQGTISISGYPMYCEKHIDKTLPTITIIQNNLVDEATLREQIAGEIEARKLSVIEQSKIGVQPEDADFYRKIFERAFNDAAAIARGNHVNLPLG